MVQYEEEKKGKYEVDVTRSQSAQAAQGLDDVNVLILGLKGQSVFLKETQSLCCHSNEPL